MNLQQMEYIVALDKYRHFVLAAEACGVTQPTLSAMIQKLEEELDVKIFERSRRSVIPTSIGVKIIRQAQTALNETQRIKEVVADETGAMNGSLHIGIVPTIAPYIVPDFIYHFQHTYPNMKLHLDERDNKGLLQELAYGNLDMIMTTSPLKALPYWKYRSMWSVLSYISPRDANGTRCQAVLGCCCRPIRCGC